MSINLVIFDCDGVLVDSERLASRVLRDILNELGGTATTEDVISVFKGKTLGEHPQLAHAHFGVILPTAFNEIYREALRDAFQRELQPIAGIEHVLANLKAQYCVASNSGRERVELSLRTTRLKPYFGERIFTVDDVQRGKPAPDLFLYAAEKFGADPVSVVVVEDSLTGVAAAVAAGMRVFGYADLTPAESLLLAGATPFTNMSELHRLLSEV